MVSCERASQKLSNGVSCFGVAPVFPGEVQNCTSASFFHVIRCVVRLPVIYLSTLHVSLDTLGQYFERDSSSFAQGHFAMTLPLRSD